MIANPRIMIVDDEQDMLKGTCLIFKSLGFDPLPVSAGKMACELIEREEFDLVLCDLLMPDVDGMAVLETAVKKAPETPFVIFTAYGTIDRAVNAMRAGAFDFLEKPIEVEKLRIILEKGFRQRELFIERQNLLDQLDTKYSFDNIVGKSPAITQVFEMINSVAPSESNILITGESGTGKELIARSIHARSNRKVKAFVPVNCSAFPEHLFEAEIFGYEKGAFTGASQRKIGLLEYANGGTFFLDEVCELPLNLQAKMLRVLQDQQLRRLGGNKLIQINARIISASNRDLDKALKEGIIREDFYYRLNVINIHIPPLREREGDVPLLAEYFLKNALETSSKYIKGFNSEAMDALKSHQWPGNVRELENIVERAVALVRTEEITPDDLPPNMLENRQGEFTGRDNMSLAEAKQRAIETVEKEYLFHQLKKHRGNVTRLAEESGMTRRNIHRLLSKYELDPKIWR
ncbi:MAG: sigma-54-dependent Fis family transcriptional regulator [FCB group bacterium]|nr:sigma-54-dependent Fis family transcriptional regulator [FCB group bacterium]